MEYKREFTERWAPQANIRTPNVQRTQSNQHKPA